MIIFKQSTSFQISLSNCVTYWPSQNMLQLGLDFSLHISTLQGVHDSMMVSQNSNGILHLWPFSGSPQGKVAFSFPVCSLRVPALAIKTYFVRNMANKIWYEFILSFFLQQLSLVYCSSKYDTKYPHIYIYRYSPTHYCKGLFLSLLLVYDMTQHCCAVLHITCHMHASIIIFLSS